MHRLRHSMLFRSGAIYDEVHKPLLSDELVSHPMWQATFVSF